jgi:DNA-binding response OmpR family regulator
LYGDELTEEGYDVVEIDNDIDMIGAIVEKQPDAVILDAELIAGDSDLLLHHIRQFSRDIPIILTTLRPLPPFDERARIADDWVVKGSGTAELREKIRMALDAPRGGHTSGLWPPHLIWQRGSGLAVERETAQKVLSL